MVAHPLPGYWRDLGEPHKYLAAHRDVLTDDLGVLDDPDWPILTRQPQRVPARVLDGGSVTDSLLSPGLPDRRLGGALASSVPASSSSPARPCATASSSRDSIVRAGATVDWSVVDSGCTIERDASVGSPTDDVDDPDLVVLVGRGSRVLDGTSLGLGSRLEPGTTA